MRRHARVFLSTTLLWVLLLLLHDFPGMADAALFSAADGNDLYGILGVARGATKEEIKKAFRRITREHHPDMQDTLEAKEMAKQHMVKVLRAYKILSDDIQRHDFDSFGVVPGEELNATEFTAEEIFMHFHQQSPIVSKTRHLESLQALQRILNFRGNRLFLLQVYDDACKSCRWFGQMWENFAQSSLVEGGVVEMLRIDAFAPESPTLLQALGINYHNEVDVFAIVDGKKWHMPQLKAALKSRSGQVMYSAMVDFVTNFFYDRQKELTSLKAGDDAEVILKWLQEERGAADAVRVLVPPLMEELAVLTLSLLHDGAAVFRSVSQAALLSLVENYCHEPIELRDRNGELLPMPEFLVISTEQLHNDTSLAPTEDSHAVSSCRGITVGVSAALTYHKAASFVRDSLPSRHPGMTGVAHVTGFSFYELCRRHCLLWLRESCEEAPADALLKTLQGDYKPFVTGYVCMDSEPALVTALHLRAKNLLVAILDGSEERLHLLPGDLGEKHIAGALSQLLREDSEGTPIQLAVPMSQLLTSQPFYMSQQQYWYMCLQSVIGIIYPFASNCYPFFMMFIMHKVMRRFNLLGGDGDGSGSGSNNNNNNTNNSSSGGGDSGNGNSNIGSSGSSSNKNSANETEQHRTAASSAHATNTAATTTTTTCNGALQTYSAADLEAAQCGKGFLLLLLLRDDGPPPILPAVVYDTRFTVRVVPPHDPVWTPWLSKQEEEQQQQQQQAKNEDELPTSNEEVAVIAIRKGKMRGALKPMHATLESWLFDLLDGTVVASISLQQA